MLRVNLDANSGDVKNLISQIAAVAGLVVIVIAGVLVIYNIF